jgi:hypothetical protein
MKKSLVIPIVLALVVALFASVPAYAAAPDQPPVETQGRLLRISGVVVSVDVSASTLVFKPQRGAQVTLTVDDKTRFTGAASSLDEINPGMQAVIAAHREQGGVVRLVGIFTRVPSQRYRGQVESVDASAGTLTLKTRQGDVVAFSVDENTRFEGHNMTVESLEDIQPGMWAGILAVQTAEGSLLARGILVGSSENLPKVDVRMGGKVIAVTENSFTIENRKGEEITFQVDENTRFHSRQGNVTKINQLKENMLVMVGGQALDEGGYLAKVVLVVQRKP